MRKIVAWAIILVTIFSIMIVPAFADETADDLMTPYGRYDNTVELTVGRRSDPNAIWPSGDDINNNFFTRYIEDQLNVKLTTAWAVDTTAYVEKISLDMMAGALPDIFSLSADDYLTYKTLYENNMLADLTDVFEQCANWYLKDTAASYDYRHFDLYTEDGRLMGLPTGKYGYEHNLFWVRGDILDELGIAADSIKTLEDIENVLVKAKEAHPEKIALALNATDPLTNYGVSFSADPIAMMNGGQPRQWIDADDGTVTYGSIQPGMKTALATLADWYKRGLIDTEFATRTGNGQMDALTTSGEAMAWFAPWWFGWNVTDLYTNVEGAYVVPINAPLDVDGNYNVPWGPPAGSVMLVSANCKNPEAVIKVINMDFDMTRGFNEEFYRLWNDARDENNPDRLVVNMNQLEPGGINIEYDNVVPAFGHGIQTYLTTGSLDDLTCPTEVSETMMAAGYAHGDPEYQDAYSRAVYISRAVAAPITDAENVVIHYPAFSRITDSYADVWPSLLDLEKVTMLQIVMGEKPIDAFDDFVAQWLAEGGQTLIEEVNAAVAAEK